MNPTMNMVILMGLTFAIAYFLLIRPQKKKESDRKKMIDELKKGDKVITIGGIYGTVTAVKEEQKIVVLKIADGASKVEFSKSAIQNKI